MSDTVPFEGFQKIPRLNRRLIITEKIDGTNAQIYITDEGELHVGSRNRWLGPGQDNMGFYHWAMQNKDELLTLGPGRHFGEWWGKGIQKHTGIEGKRFSLFNVSRWRDVHGTNDLFDQDFTKQETVPSCCYVVPVLAILTSFSTIAINDVLKNLQTYGSAAALGYMKPEGVIIYHEASGSLYKVTCEGDEVPKGGSTTQANHRNVSRYAIEQASDNQTGKDSI